MGGTVLDIVFIGLTVISFGLLWALVRAFDRV